MLDEEQAKQIKKKIINEIDSWQTGEEQKAIAKEQIESMPAAELEKFLIKNKLIKMPGKDDCPFCLIVEKKILAFIIKENKDSLAVLEIKPLSRGHTIIIPKQHTDNISREAKQFAMEIAAKIKEKLNPKEIKIENSSLLGHNIINIIPVYEGKKLERKQAEEQELKELQKQLTELQEIPVAGQEPIQPIQQTKPVKPRQPGQQVQPKEKKPEKLEKAPRRIP